MLKANMGWSEERLAQQILFGLSEGNLTHLEHQPDSPEPTGPIPIDGKDIGFPNVNFVIFKAEQDQAKFAKQLEEKLQRLGEGELPVLDIEGGFYVVPISAEDDPKRMSWILGLHDESFLRLRAGKELSFRARIIDGEGINVEIHIIWGETEEALAAILKGS